MTWRVHNIRRDHREVEFEFRRTIQLPTGVETEEGKIASWDIVTRTWINVIPSTVAPFLESLSPEDLARVIAAQMEAS